MFRIFFVASPRLRYDATMTLKLAIIGTGKVAREEYIPFLATQSDVSLGYFNRTAQSAHFDIAQQFPGPVVSERRDVADWKPPAPLILTSETARYQAAKTLINAGIPEAFLRNRWSRPRARRVTEADFHHAKELLTLASSPGIAKPPWFSTIVFSSRRARQGRH